MSTWRARTSTASLAGACVFAVVTGAGAVFVGDWWGQHHGPVVVQYVGPSGSSSARPAHAADALPGGARNKAKAAKTTREVAAEPDANQARSTTGASSPSGSHPGGGTAPTATKAPRPAPSATSVTPTQPASPPSATETTPPATDPPSSPGDPGGTNNPGGGPSGGPATGTAS